ncbi:MAG TPA: aminotransferase class III-fold pyridoxal phosphate-dependent enzyme [Pyrinomonadaceae bacterium]|nr:aminotransferase class III-fold pyridoxal phosphate-dependent enzyme [Pyrinomonadaceae bacterium]
MKTDRRNPECWAHWDQLLQDVESSPETLIALLEPNGEMSLADEQTRWADRFVCFKGSFNPIHNGHISLFNAALTTQSNSSGAFALSFHTFKRPLSREDLLFRTRLIHLAGYPVMVSRSGRFSHIAEFFRKISPALQLVFPVGIDVLLRLLNYYELSEFEALFSNSSFEYFSREGFNRELPSSFSGYPRVSFLGENRYSFVTSSKLWQLCAEEAGDQVRALMPSGAVEYFLAATPEKPKLDHVKSPSAASWPFLPGKKTFAVARAEGSYLYLSDGRRVLDAAGGGGVVNVGHKRLEVISAISSALSNLSYTVPGFATPERLALIEHLQEHWLPKGLSRVQLLGSGSDAVEAAVMLARKYHVACGRLGRWKTIGRDVSYHGATLGSLAIGGHDGRKAGLGPLLPGFSHAPACYCLRCPFGETYPACNVSCAHALEKLIEREGVETIAAFIAEPIVGSSGGALVPPDEYWPTIRDICQRHNILLIADEIITGFGRTGERFAVDYWDVKPDILVVGKGLTGGYAPLAAIFASEMLVDPIASLGGSLTAHTFDGHGGSCAAAKSVLEIILREQLIERVREKGQVLGDSLAATLATHPAVAEIRGRGLLWAIEIVRDRTTLERYPRSANVTRRIVNAGIEMGVFFYPGGTTTERDIIVLSPPFIVELEDMAEMVRVLRSAIDQVLSENACR